MECKKYFVVISVCVLLLGYKIIMNEMNIQKPNLEQDIYGSTVLHNVLGSLKTIYIKIILRNKTVVSLSYSKLIIL